MSPVNNNDDDNRDPRYDVTPHPDPTRLSSAQVFREVGALRTLIETRLDAMDNDRALIRKRLDTIPDMIAEAVLALRHFA